MRESENLSSSEDEDGQSKVEKPRKMSKKTARAEKYKEMKEDAAILGEMKNPIASTSAPMMREQAKIMKNSETSEPRKKLTPKAMRMSAPSIPVKRKSTRVSNQVEGKSNDSSNSNHTTTGSVAKRRKMRINSSDTNPDESDLDTEKPDSEPSSATATPQQEAVSEQPIAVPSSETPPGADLNQVTSSGQTVDSQSSLSNPTSSIKRGRGRQPRYSQNASTEISDPNLSALNYRIGVNGNISADDVASVPSVVDVAKVNSTSKKRTGKENNSDQNDTNKPQTDESTVPADDSNCKTKKLKLFKNEGTSSARTRADSNNQERRSSSRFAKGRNPSTSTG